MDPISAAVIAAITAGLNNGLPKVAEKAITEGFESLKELLKRKTGEQSEVVQAVEKLEANPESSSRQAVVQEEVRASKLGDDSDVAAAAQRLLEQIELETGGKQHIVNVIASGARSISIGGNITGGSVSTGDQSQAPSEPD